MFTPQSSPKGLAPFNAPTNRIHLKPDMTEKPELDPRLLVLCSVVVDSSFLGQKTGFGQTWLKLSGFHLKHVPDSAQRLLVG